MDNKQIIDSTTGTFTGPTPKRGPWVWVPQDSGKLDLSPALHHGTMVSFSRIDCPITRVPETVYLVDEWMEEFNPDIDHLMLIGDPVLIALCANNVAQRFKSFSVLKWNRQTREYIPLKVERPR